MDKKNFLTRTKRFLRTLYLKLFRINDSPQRVAAGFGIGVFLGVMPGMGPIAALACAFVFRVNRASALLASIITNTWLSIPVFLLSVKIGATVTGSTLERIGREWGALTSHFTWAELFHASLYKIAAPVLAGYAIVSSAVALLAYLLSLAGLTILKRRRAHATL